MPAKPVDVPPAVVTALERFCQRHEGETLAGLLARLGWDALCGCYFFMRGKVFHGVELDGHIHT